MCGEGEEEVVERGGEASTEHGASHPTRDLTEMSQKEPMLVLLLLLLFVILVNDECSLPVRFMPWSVFSMSPRVGETRGSGDGVGRAVSRHGVTWSDMVGYVLSLSV